MGEMFNWEIIPQGAGSPAITSDTGFVYKLRSRSIRQRLRYGERRYGINLVWASVDSLPSNVRILRQIGSGGIDDGDRVAIGIAEGGYLKYQSRDYGINLVWSSAPVHEWEVRVTSDGSSNAPIIGRQPVGLFNVVSDDFLFYDPRQYGINLKWLRDEGKYNGRHWWQHVGDAISGGWSLVFNGIKEVVWRALGIIDLILSLLGILIPKKMRLQVMVLRDLDGTALLGDEELSTAAREAELQRIDAAVDLLKDVFKDKAKINVRAAGDKFVETVSAPSPSYALVAPCEGGVFVEALAWRSGAYYRSIEYKDAKGLLLGYGQALTAIVVEKVEGKLGCSPGPFESYLFVSVSGFDAQGGPDRRPSTLVHEIGHSNGLFHRDTTSNLMYKNRSRGTDLTRWQVAWIRNSRFVTFF
jgi:hypothetical protein